MSPEPETITLAGGCFWCTEAVFKELEGVIDVVPGYAGGETENPTYREVCTGETGHAESVQVTFDPDDTGLEDILEVFFETHDPTTKDRQGPDVGSQYRSAIFYHTEEQRMEVEKFMEDMEESGKFEDPVVTEVAPLEEFWEAEDEHHDYFEKHPEAAYCVANIRPKVEKVRERFG